MNNNYKPFLSVFFAIIFPALLTPSTGSAIFPPENIQEPRENENTSENKEKPKSILDEELLKVVEKVLYKTINESSQAPSPEKNPLPKGPNGEKPSSNPSNKNVSETSSNPRNQEGNEVLSEIENLLNNVKKKLSKTVEKYSSTHDLHSKNNILL